jgi:hypothetical protein
MTHRRLLALTFAFALTSSLAHADIAPYPPRPIAGSWRAMSTHAPELKPVLDVALGAIPHRARLTGIFRAERQVVAGMNYRLVLVMANGEKWRVIVWQRADRTMRATSVEPVP